MANALFQPRALGGVAAVGVVAGALMIAAFIALNLALQTVGFTVAGLFAYDASILIGPLAFTSPVFVGLGVVLHFLVSIGWALGYAATGPARPQLLERPVVSGIVYGFLVYLAMQIVIVAANRYVIPTPSELGMALIAHCLFYGIPVAYGTARVVRG